jgi:tetratricopeptide (TPR) repeat protein
MGSNDYTRARKETIRALENFASIKAYNQLGSIHMSMSNYKDAREIFSKVLRIYPEEENSRLRLIALDLTLKDRVSARRHIDRFLQVHKDNPSCYYFLGILEIMDQNPRASLKSLRIVQNLCPESKPATPDPKRLFGLDDLYYRLALAEISLGHLHEAEIHLKKALALKSKVAYIRELSKVYFEQDQFLKAKSIILDGLKRYPSDKELNNTLTDLNKIIERKNVDENID